MPAAIYAELRNSARRVNLGSGLPETMSCLLSVAVLVRTVYGKRFPRQSAIPLRSKGSRGIGLIRESFGRLSEQSQGAAYVTASFD
jgi:hypothetical protein